MDPKLAGYEQRDAELIGTTDAVHSAQIEGKLKDVHTVLPGIIVSFDPAKQTCAAQPAIKRIFIEKGAVNLPVCVDVPVSFPGGGGFYLTFAVAAGDECTLHFSERAIDFWYANGGVQLPAEYRLHDLSDAFAMVGVNSQPNVLTGYFTGGAELRSRDRSTRISIHTSGVVEQVNSNGKTVLAEDGSFTATSPNGHTTLAADGSFTAVTPGGSHVMSAAGQFTVNCPAGMVVNGNELVNGSLAYTNGLHGQGSGTGGATAYFTGPVIADGEGTFAGGHTVSQHTHTQPPDSHGDTERPTDTPTG